MQTLVAVSSPSVDHIKPMRSRSLRIVVVSAFYSEGMGYTENCLPKVLAALGHEVHLITSTFNVYGTEPLYDDTYSEFLGPREVLPGSTMVDGYHVHRLASTSVSGYVRIKGLSKRIAALAPDVVHSIALASLPTFELAAMRPFASYRLFAESHQCLSVVRRYMREPGGSALKRAAYRLTRTLPGYLASLAVESCYAVGPDCAEVAARFYGVPERKLKLQSLGTDTDLFHPVLSDDDRRGRNELRARLGFAEADIVCIYTGRFTKEKNPLLLAKAIDELARDDPRYHGMFVGNGVQISDIRALKNVTVVPFMTHRDLARHYRAADIAVWPLQDSMSMLDAAASGVPIVASNRVGEPVRVVGNGKLYDENQLSSLVSVLQSFALPSDRRAFGDAGRRKMLEGFSWRAFGRAIEQDFLAAVKRPV